MRPSRYVQPKPGKVFVRWEWDKKKGKSRIIKLLKVTQDDLDWARVYEYDEREYGEW